MIGGSEMEYNFKKLEMDYLEERLQILDNDIPVLKKYLKRLEDERFDIILAIERKKKRGDIK